MTLRKLLVLPLIVSVAFFIYFSSEVHRSFDILLNTINLTRGFIVVIAISVVLQMVGHVIRAYKARLVFGVAKESSVRFQFRALSIGYLFDTVLPFRLGELIRARVISGAMSISFGYALVLVIFERVIDILILGGIGLLLIVIGQLHSTIIATYVIVLLMSGAIGIFIYALVARQNRHMLHFWYRLTQLFNERLKTTLRFKGWTIIYGMQKTLRPPLLKRYLALSLASWLFYGSSLFVLVEYLLRHVNVEQHIVASFAPYYGVGIPSGPASLGVFSNVVDRFTLSIPVTSSTQLVYALCAWAVLVIPIALVGVILLFTKTKETLWYVIPRRATTSSLMNKLYRTEDISDEMSIFLEHYFSGNSLTRIVHDLEVGGEFKLVKYFKGGSDAITILVMQGEGRQIVKKIIPHEFEDRLKAQYDWLQAHNTTDGIVKTLGEKRTSNYYAIDLEFDAENEMYYEFIHKNTLQQSKLVLEDAWQVLAEGVHSNVQKEKTYEAKRKAYIDKHIFGCLEKAAAVNAELIRAAEPEKLIINGVEYDNLYQIMDKIRANKKAWHDIATYRHSGAVHGDVIVDNLLVSQATGKVLVIDPAPDGNIFEGPVFDFGKLMQSLYCGYETLLRDEDPVYLVAGNKIDYRDHKSGKYTQLSNYVRDELAPKHLTESEQRAMLFHAGTLYFRRLKHQVYYTPANVLKFYAVGVKTLNDFLTQYQ